MSTTIVTALFDIKRESIEDGRTMDQYLIWFKETLKMNCPMVIFIEKQFEDFVHLHRPREYQTHIIVQTLRDVFYFKYRDDIDEIIHSESYRKRISHPNRIECNLAEYNVIQYSKFDWLKRTIDLNPFASTYFFWMDAGCSRFFLDTNISRRWPNSNHSILIIN